MRLRGCPSGEDCQAAVLEERNPPIPASQGPLPGPMAGAVLEMGEGERVRSLFRSLEVPSGDAAKPEDGPRKRPYFPPRGLCRCWDESCGHLRTLTGSGSPPH